MTVVAMGFCLDRGEASPDTPLVNSYLIAVCDTMLSAEAGATIRDSGVCKVQKAGFLGPWLIGYTGDPAHFLPLRAKFAAKLSPLSGGDSDVSDDQLFYKLRDTYTEYREEEIANQILHPWHIESVAQLRDLEHKNPETYKRLWPKVDKFNLGIEICIGGFSQKSGMQLRQVWHPGFVTKNLAHVNPGATSIGSGAGHAASHLRAWYDKHGPLKEAIYYLLEAKIMADLDVPSVGVETDLVIVAFNPRAEPRTTSHRITRENIQRFREAWLAERRAPSKSLTKLLDIEPLWNF